MLIVYFDFKKVKLKLNNPSQIQVNDIDLQPWSIYDFSIIFAGF